MPPEDTLPPWDTWVCMPPDGRKAPCPTCAHRGKSWEADPCTYCEAGSLNHWIWPEYRLEAPNDS